MGKTITIDDDAYKLLSALKRRPGDSFTKVILRHLNRPAGNCSGRFGALRQERAAIKSEAEVFEDGQAVFAEG